MKTYTRVLYDDLHRESKRSFVVFTVGACIVVGGGLAGMYILLKLGGVI